MFSCPVFHCIILEVCYQFLVNRSRQSVVFCGQSGRICYCENIHISGRFYGLIYLPYNNIGLRLVGDVGSGD